ncbi:phage tail sheath protein [Roseibium sp. TrichSKD4]|uniref:tail protein n=1 Tax=Roseibium sp. TrichSKD4 TaxID=744980 RepID=UPI0001E569C0|nr:tail protein [Roseibium sp. TrichSKD4]EFO32499.1 phage tail sheath protein [Roseibium sp. TrichSKD4]
MTSSERYFGPEVVDVDEGGAFVRELKAATAFIIGTAPIHEIHEGADAQAPYINTRVLIRRRSDITKFFGPHRDGYTLPQKLDAMFKKAKTKGIGTVCVVNVFNPQVHKDGDGNPDPSQVTALDIIGVFDAAGRPSGLKHAYACYQSFGWFPKIMLAPGFDAMTGVRAEMEVIANRIRARYLLDAPFGVTPQQVVEARGPNGSFNFQTNHTRAVGCWPHMEMVNLDETSDNAGKAVPDQYSAHLAGIWLMTVMEYGYHHSPSNRPITGIEDAAQDVLYIPGDATSDVQQLRSVGVVTCEERFGKGPHTSGNRALAYPTVTDMRNFLHVQFIEDVMDEAILHYLDEWKDRNANPASLEKVEDGINAWGLGKTTGRDPVLYDFRFKFNRKKTTSQSVADGWLYWTLDYAPVGLMERLTVERSININMIGNALGLATLEDPNAG